MAKRVHLALIDQKRGGNAWAACSGWMKVPYSLMVSAVTCKRCLKIIEKQFGK